MRSGKISVRKKRTTKQAAAIKMTKKNRTEYTGVPHTEMRLCIFNHSAIEACVFIQQDTIERMVAVC